MHQDDVEIVAREKIKTSFNGSSFLWVEIGSFHTQYFFSFSLTERDIFLL